MSPSRTHYPDSDPTSLCPFSLIRTHINFKVFGLTLSRLEPTNYRARVEYFDHYTTDAVKYQLEKLFLVHKK